VSDAGTKARAHNLADLTPAQRALLEQRLMARRAAAAQESKIAPREGDGPAPLSYAQELLWLLSQVFDDGIAYNAPGAFQLEGPLDLDVLARALEALTERHDILRTTYKVIDGRPAQLIGPVQPMELNVVDLRERSPDEREARAQRVLKEESRFRFDLIEGPVMRVTVIKLTDNEHILMVNMHHVATDGYSRTAIYRDLTALYEAIAAGRPSPLDPLPIQYADFAVWQRNWLDGAAASGQVEYWKRNLAGAPSRLDLPSDFPRPPVRSYVGSNMSLMLDMATREGLRATARRSDSTLFVALLAVFAALLSRYSGQDDVVIGTPFAGRNRTELESMVGYFINPLALRIDLSGDPTFDELIERARRTTLDAFAHADVPYETVVRATNPERDAGFPGDDRPAQPRLADPEAEVRARGHSLHRDNPREGLVEVRRAARYERAHDRPEHDLGVQHRAVSARQRNPYDGALQDARRERGDRGGAAPVAAVDAL
jgi:condensation domain-containing protein